MSHNHVYALYSLFSEAEAFFTDTQEATKPEAEEPDLSCVYNVLF